MKGELFLGDGWKRKAERCRQQDECSIAMQDCDAGLLCGIAMQDCYAGLICGTHAARAIVHEHSGARSFQRAILPAFVEFNQ